jgi:bifunctional DNA-binding transcriptional regulator/antitoxin component of YhaV-PrlF toxin-antitoxin module
MVTTETVEADRRVTLPDEIVEAAGFEPGDSIVIESTERGRVEIRSLPRLTLKEMIERWHVDEPYDDAAVREAAEDDAAREAFGDWRG